MSLIFGLVSGPINSAYAKGLPYVEKIKKTFTKRPAKASKVEIPEWRTANSKHFLKDDGSFEMELSKDSIFYQDSTSKQWKDIDNTLVPSNQAGFGFKNKANRFDVEFPLNTGTGAINKFSLDGAGIEFYPVGITPGAGIAQANKISYKNAYKSTDINYTVGSDSLKESILLNAADAPNTYSYELKLNNLKYESKKDGSIEFRYADTSSYAFTIPKPFMYEAGDMPQISDKVSQTIHTSGDQVFLDITADVSWIQDADRKYPVTIDPTVTGLNYFSDTFASSTLPTTNTSGYDHVYAGTTSSYGKTEAYIRFPLPPLPDGATVTNASVSLYNYLSKTNSTAIDVNRITSWWSESSANWNNKPTKGQKDATFNVPTAGFQSFPITNLVSDWYTGRVPNNGIALSANPDTAEPVGFTSSNYTTDTTYTPKMTIDYVIDPDGSNNFWTYTGDGVMPYKGNLFLTATDLATAGLGIDAAVTRSYNSRQLTGTGVLGPGWLSNLDMRLWDMSGSVAFLDSTGTRHIFEHLANDSYSPPAGTTLSLKRDDVNSLYKITTTNKTVYTFDMNTGKITKITDANGQTTTFTKDVPTGDLWITDASGRTPTKIHYRADGKVDYATDPKGRKVQYTYDATSSMLLTVTISYGTESVTYSYSYVPNTSLLSTVTDPKGNAVTYNYDQYNRIQSVVRKLNGANVTNTYAYDTSVTPRLVTVTGMNGEKTVYHTNDNGNVVQTDVTLNGTNTATTVYSWDVNNTLYQVDRPSQQTTKIDYGTNGLPIKVTTPDGKDTNHNYDTNNNAISVKNQLNYVSGTNYDTKNNPLEIADASGNTSMLDYDAKGNLTSVTDTMSLADNLIYNSGFEISSSNLPTGWDASRTVNASDIYQVDPGVKSGGYNSLHIKSGDSVNGLYSVMHNQIPVTQNMSYNLSGDIKLAGNSTSEFRVVWYNASGVKIQEDTGLSLSKADSYGTVWQHKATGLVAPTNAVNAVIKVGMIGAGETWFDNLTFEGGTGRSGSILDANYSFDYDADKTGLADEWYPSPVSTGISIDYTQIRDNIPIISEFIPGDPNNYKYVLQNLNLYGSKGTKLNLSGWSKHANVPSSGGFWGLQIQFTYTDDTNDWIGIQFDRSQAAWQQASRVIVAPKDFKQIAIIPTFNNMPANAQAWFDDVKLNVVDVPSSTISKYNFADNTSFEHAYDLATPNWPDGWVKSSGNGSYTSAWIDLAASNGNVYSGTHSIKMTNPSSWESVTRLNDKVPFDSSKTFTAIGYIKTVNVSSSALLLVHAYDSNGIWLGQVASQSVTGSKDWKRVSVNVNSANVPGGTAKLAVGVQMTAGTGISYFDNIRLQDGDYRTQMGYDTAGNYVNSITTPLGNKINLTTESTTGNITTLKDSLGNQSSYQYSMMNQLKSLTFPFQGSLDASMVNKTYQYSYDNNGNLQSITDPNSKTWVSLQYNELNQLKQFNETATIGGTSYSNPWIYNYDTSGRMNKVTLPTGQYTQPAYDNAGRLTGMNFGNTSGLSQTFAYGYDLNSNMTSYGTGTSKYFVQYDNMNRPQQVTEPNTANYNVNTFDDAGQRTKLSVHYGATVWDYEYGYDSNGRAQTFHDVAYDRRSWYLFDESGRPVKAFNSNGTATFYEYDRDGRINQLRIENAGQVVTKQRYDYNVNGNITKVWSDMDSSWTKYTYDSLGQLLQEEKSDGKINEYQYDELGNRTKVIKDGATTNYTYNTEKNRLITAGTKSYSYDANGNVVGDGVYTYVWGDNNKLSQVKQGSSTITSFTYDALGRRDTMTSSGVTKTFHYDGNLVSYVKESSGKLYRFAYDHSGRPIFMSYSGGQYWYHYDQHGNVISMTDSSGHSIATYNYDAWGNITSKWGTTGTGSEIVDLNPFRYSGDWYDNEIGKYFLNARYYDSQIGRFLSKDPITMTVGHALGLNSYQYAYNNPVSFVDHNGMRPEEVTDYGPSDSYMPADYSEKQIKNRNKLVSHSGGSAGSKTLSPVPDSAEYLYGDKKAYLGKVDNKAEWDIQKGALGAKTSFSAGGESQSIRNFGAAYAVGNANIGATYNKGQIQIGGEATLAEGKLSYTIPVFGFFRFSVEGKVAVLSVGAKVGWNSGPSGYLGWGPGGVGLSIKVSN